MSDPGQSIVVEAAGGVGWVRINRPDRKNAIDTTTRGELADAFSKLTDDEDVRVIVLAGSGGSFSAGVDLKEVVEEDRHPLGRGQEPLVAPVERCPKPVIAAIDGAAIGGGFELALASDMRVASTRSFFALTELRIGSLPGSGGTQRLFTAVPSAIAWSILLTGDRLDAKRAYEVGLISEVIEVEEFEQRVAELAARVAMAAPLSLRAAKLAGRAGLERSGAAGFALERSLWAALAATEDRAEGRAAFREGRDAEYRGR